MRPRCRDAWDRRAAGPPPTTLSITFYGAAQGVTYGAETSTDCQNWVTAGVAISELDPANMRTVTVNRDSTMGYLRSTLSLAP